MVLQVWSVRLVLFELLQCWPEAYLLTRKQEEHRQAFELDQLNPA